MLMFEGVVDATLGLEHIEKHSTYHKGPFPSLGLGSEVRQEGREQGFAM